MYQTAAQQEVPGADGKLSNASFIASVAAGLQLASEKTTAWKGEVFTVSLTFADFVQRRAFDCQIYFFNISTDINQHLQKKGHVFNFE